VVLCKLAEIVIMLLGTAAVAADNLSAALVVLTLMGTHSAFFGPSKFGILPEIVRERKLSRANGIFLMTTFLSIILGTAAAGFLRGFLADGGWMARSVFPGIAVLGTATALLVRKTPVAKPDLPFKLSEMAIDQPTARLFLGDRPLLHVLIAYAIFWLVGGVVLPNVNAYGRNQLGISDEETSTTTACLALGIAAGCGLAGIVPGKSINFRLVTLGTWGMIGSLGTMSVVGVCGLPSGAVLWLSRAVLVAAGGFAGLFAVPLQAFLQSRPAADQKGRVMGAMNLSTWIAILLSAAVFAGIDRLCTAAGIPISWGFLATGCLLLPVALFFRPAESPRPT
jgi:acyl-[acyl-carrier-protein]-phospholipid O-acyltransferase/long-chain-fatty-acid--[acyl-carrier-protein] ligase